MSHRADRHRAPAEDADGLAHARWPKRRRQAAAGHKLSVNGSGSGRVRRQREEAERHRRDAHHGRARHGCPGRLGRKGTGSVHGGRRGPQGREDRKKNERKKTDLPRRHLPRRLDHRGHRHEDGDRHHLQQYAPQGVAAGQVRSRGGRHVSVAGRTSSASSAHPLEPAAWMACQIRGGVAGMSMCWMP